MKDIIKEDRETSRLRSVDGAARQAPNDEAGALPSGCNNSDCPCVPYDGGPLASERMPWKVDIDGEGWAFVHNEGDIICNDDPNHHAGCVWTAARFRLIAAAPDLLGALKAMVLNDTHTYRDCHKAALAAIAKAEGRS